MKAPPFLSVSTDQWFAEIANLSNEEIGVYDRLWMTIWRVQGQSLPDDDRMLARVAHTTVGRWCKIFRPAVEPLFEVRDGKWTHHRISKEHEFVSDRREKNRSAANARWRGKTLENHKTGDANASSTHRSGICQTDAPSPSPSPSRTQSTTPPPSLNAARAEADPPKGGVADSAKVVQGAGSDTLKDAGSLAHWATEFLSLGVPIAAAPFVAWLQAGASPELIRATMTDVMAHKAPGWKPQAIGYFGKAILRAAAEAVDAAGRSAASFERGGSSKIPSKSDVDQMERINARLIAERGFQSDVSAHAVRQMVAKKLLTAEEATKAGYRL